MEYWDSVHLLEKKDTARNHENKWVESYANERGAFTGVIFLKKYPARPVLSVNLN
jgi:hypothetical protein